jgi:hypothetical protein
LRDGNPAFAEVAGTRPLFARVEGYALSGELVTANYFRMLSVSAAALRSTDSEVCALRMSLAGAWDSN